MGGVNQMVEVQVGLALPGRNIAEQRTVCREIE